jgi:hypothetical protein
LVRTIEIEDPIVSHVFEAAFPVFKGGENRRATCRGCRPAIGRAINVDTMAGKLQLGRLRDAFVEITVGTGILVEEPKGSVSFDHPETLDYFCCSGRCATL